MKEILLALLLVLAVPVSSAVLIESVHRYDTLEEKQVVKSWDSTRGFTARTQKTVWDVDVYHRYVNGREITFYDIHQRRDSDTGNVTLFIE